MPPRRSVWETDDNSASPPACPTPPAEDRWGAAQPPTVPEPPPSAAPFRPGTMLDRIPIAVPRPEPTRNRAWEKQHPTRSYRKIPAEVREAVNQVAEDTGYTTSQIAQVFLEFALYCFQRGDFQLEVGLGPRGTTLFPGGGWEARKPAWAENTSWERTPPKKKARKRKRARAWEVVVTYRLSIELSTEIDRVCVPLKRNGRPEYTYQPGEVVTRFLVFSLEAYAQGTLLLEDGRDA